jgi:hypothetical protein
MSRILGRSQVEAGQAIAVVVSVIGADGFPRLKSNVGVDPNLDGQSDEGLERDLDVYSSVDVALFVIVAEAVCDSSLDHQQQYPEEEDHPRHH